VLQEADGLCISKVQTGVKLAVDMAIFRVGFAVALFVLGFAGAGASKMDTATNTHEVVIDVEGHLQAVREAAGCNGKTYYKVVDGKNVAHCGCNHNADCTSGTCVANKCR